MRSRVYRDIMTKIQGGLLCKLNGHLSFFCHMSFDELRTLVVCIFDVIGTHFEGYNS